MGNAKHTRGPWKLIDEPRNKHYRNADRYGYENVMQHCRYIAGPDHDSHFVADVITERGAKGEANARLIAAAPDLLEALKQCAAVVAGDTMHKQGLIDALTIARAAISKATK